MNQNEKIKVAITAGIAGLILLILVLFIALSGNGDKSENVDNTSAEAVTEGSLGKDNKEDESVSSSEASENNEDSAEDATSGAASNKSATSKTSKKTVSGNSFYETTEATLHDVYKNVKYDVNSQMEEILVYCRDNNQEAIWDLAHLERFEAMSYSLEKADEFYYAGDVNENGLPDGFGVACYANDQYYYGEWVNGVRSGQGTWISFYPDYDTYVVSCHMYSGAFKNDLPNGEGQEHYDYNTEYMNDKDIYIQNVIGNFTDGYYDGEMYVITIYSDGSTREWNGICDMGTWQTVANTVTDKSGNNAVLSEIENKDNHIWMSPEKAKNNMVSGIIK